ncbi:unnamed protein product [Pieris macdunnoughi]|uniref:Peptidase S1 domain-containing protein n=2 Tax=Pieris macdunnoughi TaxID=345717 RepID=A0A821XGR3_9NEOP|nr:unnamed protein product [Pieris macdunnoughi]
MAMHFIVYLILALCSGVLTASTKNEAVPQARIIGGHEAKPYSHPYLVSLQLRFLWLRGHICGGSIIKENWVLTAAHCIQESWLTRWLPLEAVAGTNDVYDFGSLAQVNSVDQRIPHPNYQGGIGPYDIAVLRTATPFYFTREVQPIQLPLNSNIDGESLQLAGWGALRTTSFLPDLPSRLQEVEVKYIPYDECNNAVAELLENDESNPLDRNAHICTGPLSGGIAACSGDSGGPLIEMVPSEANDDEAYDDNFEDSDKLRTRNDDSSIPVIRGIVSWGISPCGIEGGPTVFTNVFEYIDFVKQYSDTPSSSIN